MCACTGPCPVSQIIRLPLISSESVNGNTKMVIKEERRVNYESTDRITKRHLPYST